MSLYQTFVRHYQIFKVEYLIATLYNAFENLQVMYLYQLKMVSQTQIHDFFAILKPIIKLLY